jgi:hypothetical protein
MKSPPFGVENSTSINSRFYHTRLYNNHIHESFFMSKNKIEDKFEEFSLKDDFVESPSPKVKFAKKVVEGFFFKNKEQCYKN